MTRQSIPGQWGKGDYDHTQGQRGYPIEGSNRPSEPRVQHSSNSPDRHSPSILQPTIYARHSHSHSMPMPMVQPRHDYSPGWEDPSRVDRESWKADKYFRKPQKHMFNPYSSSSRHPADRVDPSSRRRDEEDSSDDSDSSAGSGCEIAAPSHRLERGIRSTVDHKTAPSILTRSPLDTYHGSSDPSGLSKSKSQQSWVAEPSGYEKESARLPAHLTSSRQDSRGRRTDTDPVVGSYRGGAGDGISGHPRGSQTRSGNKEKESARSLRQPSSSHQEPRVRETDADYGTGGQGSVGGYRDEAGGRTSGQLQPWAGKPAPAPAASSTTRRPSGNHPEYTFGDPTSGWSIHPPHRVFFPPLLLQIF